MPALKPVSAVNPASPVETNVTAIEVYTAKVGQYLRLGTPQPESGIEETRETPSDTKWAMDGLEHDRNPVVQAVSCVAAIPFGFWEQTVGAVWQHSRDKTGRLVATLEAIPDQGHFADKLTDEVARRLSAQALNQVRRNTGSHGVTAGGLEPPAAPPPTTREDSDAPAVTPTLPAAQPFALAIAGGARTAEPAEARTSTNSLLALRIQVGDARLLGKHRGSRSRALCVQVQATIIRTSDGQELYSRPILYRGAPRKLKDWAASDAKLFRQELEACSQQTAQALTTELMGRGFVTQGAGPSVHSPL